MDNFILSIIVFIIIYLFYLFFVILRKKKLEKFKKNSYVRVLVNRYNVDIDNINFKNLVHVIALTNSFIVSGTFFIMGLFNNFYIGLLVGVVVLVVLELLMYKLLGMLYGKKEK